MPFDCGVKRMEVYVVLKWVYDMGYNETSFSCVECVCSDISKAKEYIDRDDEYLGNNRWGRYTFSVRTLC